jgi:hypothetical protein
MKKYFLLLSLGFRWWVLNIKLIGICAAIAFWSRTTVITIRWQVRLLRWSGLAVFSFFCMGCAHNAEISFGQNHSAADTAMTAARASQQSASYQINALSNSLSDPSAKKAAKALQQTISDLGIKLEIATGKLSWYETQFDIVSKQAQVDRAARVQSEKERDALIWVFSLICGMTALASFRPALQVVQMPWQVVALGAVFSGGFTAGFVAGRYCLRTMALFTPHLPF